MRAFLGLFLSVIQISVVLDKAKPNFSSLGMAGFYIILFPVTPVFFDQS